jgi:hypothetical protein
VPATAPSLANPWLNPTASFDSAPVSPHPLGARQALRDTVRAGRVAVTSLRAAGRRRLEQRRHGG